MAGLGLVSLCSSLLWGCLERLDVGSRASFSAGPLNKPAAWGRWQGGTLLHAEC